jgi:hypothetical protein
MADGATAPALHSLKGQVSEEEWKARVDLAALYRLAAHEGWDDMIFTHISARVPGPEHHFLINPYGWFFEEMTASALIKVDLDGQHRPADLRLHQSGRASPSTRRSTPRGRRELRDPPARRRRRRVSAQRDGLLPLTQHALIVCRAWPTTTTKGSPSTSTSASGIVADLGDKDLMMLRNHGTLALGAYGGGGLARHLLPRARLPPADHGAQRRARRRADRAPEAQEEVKGQTVAMPMVASLAWPGLLRRLNRELPGYDA